MAFGTVLGYSYMAFRSLKYTYVGKRQRQTKQTNADLDRNTAVFLENLQICDLQVNHYKFFKIADLRFADWHTSEICGFAIAELAQEFADLQFADYPKKIACPVLNEC